MRSATWRGLTTHLNKQWAEAVAKRRRSAPVPSGIVTIRLIWNTTPSFNESHPSRCDGCCHTIGKAFWDLIACLIHHSDDQWYGRLSSDNLQCRGVVLCSNSFRVPSKHHASDATRLNCKTGRIVGVVANFAIWNLLGKRSSFYDARTQVPDVILFC